MIELNKQQLKEKYPNIPNEILEWYIDTTEKFNRLMERYIQLKLLETKDNTPQYQNKIRELIHQLQHEISDLEKELLS